MESPVSKGKVGRKRKMRRTWTRLVHRKKRIIAYSPNPDTYESISQHHGEPSTVNIIPSTPDNFHHREIRKPQKPSKRKSRARRALFKDDESVMCEQLKEYLPSIVTILGNTGMLKDFVTLIFLLATGKMSPYDLPFMLCLEKARYLGLSKVSEMWYWPETKKWWKVVYKLLRGKALRLMSGPKLLGHLVDGMADRTSLNPQSATTNFAVPDVSVVRNFIEQDNLPSTVSPGILEGAVKIAQNSEKFYVLSIDGKKVAAGLKGAVGDIDLWGYEQPSLQDAQQRLVSETQLIQSAMTTEDFTILLEYVKEVIRVLSLRIKDTRELVVKQQFALTKFEQLSEKSQESQQKYIFAISSTRATLHQATGFINHCLSVIAILCFHASKLNSSSHFNNGPEINLIQQGNAVSLKEPKDLSSDLAGVPEYTKQRTDEWHELRKQTYITGSSIHRGIGLSTLKEQKQHYDTKVLGKPASEPSPEVALRMKQGTEDEDKAVATLTALVLPSLFGSEYIYFEEGASFISGSNGHKLVEVSSDGTVRKITNECIEKQYVVEIKRPQETKTRPPVHYSPPTWYICQLLAEMKAHDTDKALYLSYSTESMTICRVSFDEDLWNEIYSEVDRLYGDGTALKMPTRISEPSKIIKRKLLPNCHVYAVWLLLGFYLTFVKMVPRMLSEFEENIASFQLIYSHEISAKQYNMKNY